MFDYFYHDINPFEIREIRLTSKILMRQVSYIEGTLYIMPGHMQASDFQQDVPMRQKNFILILIRIFYSIYFSLRL